MARYQTTVCKSGVCKSLRRRNSLPQAERDMRRWIQAEAKRLKARTKDIETEIKAFVSEVGSDEVLREGEIRIGGPRKRPAKRKAKSAESSEE